MTKEDLQNRIEQIAYDGATDGCNQAVIEREASKLAREIVKLFAIQNVSKTFTAEEMTDEEIKNSPWLSLEKHSDKLTPEQLDYCARKSPWAALEYCAEKLTSEQFDYCVRESAYKALRDYADKLTSEQFDFCIRECPATALMFRAAKLTEEQKKYCEERTK